MPRKSRAIVVLCERLFRAAPGGSIGDALRLDVTGEHDWPARGGSQADRAVALEHDRRKRGPGRVAIRDGDDTGRIDLEGADDLPSAVAQEEMEMRRTRDVRGDLHAEPCSVDCRRELERGALGSEPVRAHPIASA